MTLDVPVVGSIGEVELRAGDAVFLAMKTQDTPGALEDLARVAPPGIAVVCAQNGVENERLALRHFPDVYGICAILPATLIDPGVIDMNGAPKNAILDIGRYPAGSDATAEAIAEMLEASDMPSVARRDIMRWKYYKLVMNLVNAIDALLSDPDAAAGILQQAKEEAATCFAAAGIEAVDRETFLDRSKGVMEVVPIPGHERRRWVHLAEPCAGRRDHRDRLVERRDRAARPGARHPDAGELGAVRADQSGREQRAGPPLDHRSAGASAALTVNAAARPSPSWIQAEHPPSAVSSTRTSSVAPGVTGRTCSRTAINGARRERRVASSSSTTAQ